jgi:dethiobiotin synthetase
MTAQAVFIAGTDTDVGKTVITAGLAMALLDAGHSVCVYKPVQTGTEDLSQPVDPMSILNWLSQDNGMPPEKLHVTASYVFHEPVAPWVADPEGTIRLEKLITDFQELQQRFDWVLVEGAGGLRVPVTANHDTMDVIEALSLPTILVARPNLGTINHTLLSLDALAQRNLDCLGVVVSNMPGHTQLETTPDLAISSLPDVFAQWLPVPVLGWIPKMPLDAPYETRQQVFLNAFSPWVKALPLRLKVQRVLA